MFEFHLSLFHRKTCMNFSPQLLSWYREHKRDLPWRRTKDPYLVWLSEIIMQQTRIDQGLPYYERFAEAYPTVAHLAAASEQDILKLWQGLGYYSRARNLHQTARMIMEEHGGTFPATYESIGKLRGVGGYTAAAIASIVFDLPHPVVDGNVVRFITRLYGITDPADLPATKKRVLELASENIDHRHPGDFNQAMMEFGAMVCTPANPGCMGCIFKTGCAALARGLVASIPSRTPKPAVRKRFLHYLVVTFEGGQGVSVFLNKRSGNDIWRNMYDFPQAVRIGGEEDGRPMDEPAIRKGFTSALPEFTGVSGEYLHVLTHQKLSARFYRFHSGSKMDLPYTAVPVHELAGYPVPRLIDRYLSENPVG
jgi:A/G-specific adenine glycosylase